MRTLARVVELDDVLSHENADSLELAIIGGWQVVVKKDEFKKNDKVVFFEVDSWIPTELAPFLSKGKEPREFNGVRGEKLRTIKLRGELSQGLVLPLSILGDVEFQVDDDVSEVLNIQKWELPESTQLAGMSRGNFPSWIQKTDQERIQNWSHKIKYWNEQGLEWTVQEKLEGSSCTVYMRDGEFGVCSRNIDLKEDEHNTFWKTVNKYNLRDIIAHMDSIAFQFELIGPGVQGNIYGLDEHELRLFDIQDRGRYLSEPEVKEFSEFLGVPMVPQLGGVSFSDVSECLALAEGKSALNSKVEREGVVFRCTTKSDLTFKAISNRYLLKQEN